jgi:hypothetical protein
MSDDDEDSEDSDEDLKLKTKKKKDLKESEPNLAILQEISLEKLEELDNSVWEHGLRGKGSWDSAQRRVRFLPKSSGKSRSGSKKEKKKHPRIYWTLNQRNLSGSKANALGNRALNILRFLGVAYETKDCDSVKGLTPEAEQVGRWLYNRRCNKQ